jgi:hypothetical protein
MSRPATASVFFFLVNLMRKRKGAIRAPASPQSTEKPEILTSGERPTQY